MRALLSILTFGLATTLSAAEPTIRTIDIRGLRIGGATAMTIEGDDLGKSPQLLLPFAVMQKLVPGATDKKAAFEVTLTGPVEPGYHHLRLVTEKGVSAPVVIGVDRLMQLTMTPEIKELPVALHGSVAGSNIVETKFQGKAKQRVTIEVESQRLGAKLRPVVHLYNAKKLQIAWSWGTPSLFGDARLETELPADGTYTVTLHDAEYAAPNPSFFRLKIGQWSRVDQVFPPVIAKGQPWTIGLLGAKPAEMTVTSPMNAEVVALSWPKTGDDWSGPRPFVHVSQHAEYVESAKSDKLQEIPEGLAGISGRLMTPNEEDRYRVAVKPGTKVKLEVFAERLGSPLDVALVVRNDKDAQLARAEDSPGTLDPVLEYAVPDKVTSIIVGVVDAQGRGGPRGIYRLVIDPGSTQEGFNLSTTIQQISIPAKGSRVVPVIVDRRGGYRGPIELIADPPSRGLSMKGTTIEAGMDGTLVTLERLDSVPEPIVITLRGRAATGIEKAVAVKNHPLERLQPWLATELAVARSSDDAKEFAVEWRDLPEKTAIVPAGRLLLPVKLTRPMGKNTVKLTLVTSQNTPIVNNQPDPNKAIRQDKIGELPEKVLTGDVTLLVPPDLQAPSYDVTVQAELLDPAKKVLAIAHTPVRRLAVNIPITVALKGPARIETTFDPKKGAALKLEGTVERREGVKADIAIALTGLPAGIKPQAVTVKGDASAFTVDVTFPPTVAPGEFRNVKLSGSYVPDPKQPNVRVRSREVELTLVLKAPAK